MIHDYKTAILIGGSSTLGSIVLGQGDGSLSAPTTALGTVILGNVVMLGLLGWLVKVLISVTIPKMQDSHEKILDGLRTSFKTMLDQQANVFQVQMDQARIQAKAESDAVRAHCIEETTAVRSDLKESRDMFEKKLTFERELFERQLNIIMVEGRENREAFTSALKLYHKDA